MRSRIFREEPKPEDDFRRGERERERERERGRERERAHKVILVSNPLIIRYVGESQP